MGSKHENCYLEGGGGRVVMNVLRWGIRIWWGDFYWWKGMRWLIGGFPHPPLPAKKTLHNSVIIAHDGNR